MKFSKEFLEQQKSPPVSPGRPKIGSERLVFLVPTPLKARMETALRLSKKRYTRVPKHLRSKSAFLRFALEQALEALDMKEGSDG